MYKAVLAWEDISDKRLELQVYRFPVWMACGPGRYCFAEELIL
jgi:hypothetical protein